MNTAAATQWFEQNKKTVAVAGAVVVGGFGLMKARKGKAGGETPPARTVGDMGPAGAAGFAQSAPYDSSSSDVYNQLQPQIERLQQRLESPIPVPVPPAASSMFAPTGRGNYVRYDNGTIAEVQSDGSLYGLNPDEWNKVASGGATFTRLVGPQPNIYTGSGNLTSRNPLPLPQPASS